MIGYLNGVIIIIVGYMNVTDLCQARRGMVECEEEGGMLISVAADTVAVREDTIEVLNPIGLTEESEQYYSATASMDRLSG